MKKKENIVIEVNTLKEDQDIYMISLYYRNVELITTCLTILIKSFIDKETNESEKIYLLKDILSEISSEFLSALKELDETPQEILENQQQTDESQGQQLKPEDLLNIVTVNFSEYDNDNKHIKISVYEGDVDLTISILAKICVTTIMILCDFIDEDYYKVMKQLSENINSLIGGCDVSSS